LKSIKQEEQKVKEVKNNGTDSLKTELKNSPELIELLESIESEDFPLLKKLV